MLNNEDRKKAEKLLENITLEIQGKATYDISLDDIQWLAQTLIDKDNKIRRIFEGYKGYQSKTCKHQNVITTEDSGCFIQNCRDCDVELGIYIGRDK